MSMDEMICVRRSISRTLSMYASRVARSPAPNSFWNDFVRSRMASRRLSDSRAFSTRSFGVVEPNKELKTFFGLYSIGSGVFASRNEIVAAVPTPLPAACWVVVSEETSRVGIAVSCPIFFAMIWSMVGDGVLQHSQVPGFLVCTPAPAGLSRFPMVETYFLNGSSDPVILFSLKLAPEPLGDRKRVGEG